MFLAEEGVDVRQHSLGAVPGEQLRIHAV